MVQQILKLIDEQGDAASLTRSFCSSFAALCGSVSSSPQVALLAAWPDRFGQRFAQRLQRMTSRLVEMVRQRRPPPMAPSPISGISPARTSDVLPLPPSPATSSTGSLRSRSSSVPSRLVDRRKATDDRCHTRARRDTDFPRQHRGMLAFDTLLKRRLQSLPRCIAVGGIALQTAVDNLRKLWVSPTVPDGSAAAHRVREPPAAVFQTGHRNAAQLTAVH